MKSILHETQIGLCIFPQKRLSLQKELSILYHTGLTKNYGFHLK